MSLNTKRYFDDFNTQSKVWIFMAETTFSDKDLNFIIPSLEKFLSQWNTHGSYIKSGFELIENQFIVIIADETISPASGCSIDSLLRFIKWLENKLGCSLTNRMNIAYKKSEKLCVTDLFSFKKAIKNGEILHNCKVYNNSISTLADFREQWLLPLEKSWARRFVQKI